MPAEQVSSPLAVRCLVSAFQLFSFSGFPGRNSLRRMKFLVLALSCLLFVSCASNETPKTENLIGPFRGGYLSRISVGMPKAEVIRQIGEPFSVAGKDNIEVFTYRDVQNAPAQAEDYFVRFVEGKVESFGNQSVVQPVLPNKPVKPTP
jgi:hypothetical protein